MAKQTSLITFTGRLGDIIGYCRNDRYFFRSRPQTVRQTTIGSFFAVMPAVSKNGVLHIAAQRLPLLKDIHALEVKVIAARIHFAQQRVTGMNTAVIYIDPRQPFEGTTLQMEVPGEGTLVITLQVRGFRDGKVSAQSKYLAADIIAVISQQTRQGDPKPVNPQDRRVTERVRIPRICTVIQRE